MDSGDSLRRFEAESGYGKDAAGRDVYTGPFHLYMGPGDFARTQAEHATRKNAVAKDDPQGMLIRKLLEEQANASMAAKANIPVFPIGQGNTTYNVREQ
jgi:hypothetical protein